MPVGADSEDLQVDPAGIPDGLVIGRTGGRDIGGQAVGSLDRPGCEIHPGDEHGVDDVAVALRMVGRQTHVLVESEAAGLLEGDPPLLISGGQFVVDRQW